MAENLETPEVAPDADPAVSDKPPVEEREPSPEPSAPARIIINPKVFKDKRDGLCVAYNEAFRVIMEMNGFDPQAEPTEEQRKFFSDTAYADDERMLRRTILARICTFDDSVKNPTDEQLDEALEFLETVMEIGAPQSEEEQANVQRIHDMIAKVREAPRPEEAPVEEAPVESEAPPTEEAAPPVSAVKGGHAMPGLEYESAENAEQAGGIETGKQVAALSTLPYIGADDLRTMPDAPSLRRPRRPTHLADPDAWAPEETGA